MSACVDLCLCISENQLEPDKFSDKIVCIFSTKRKAGRRIMAHQKVRFTASFNIFVFLLFKKIYFVTNLKYLALSYIYSRSVKSFDWIREKIELASIVSKMF